MRQEAQGVHMSVNILTDIFHGRCQRLKLQVHIEGQRVDHAAVRI